MPRYSKFLHGISIVLFAFIFLNANKTALKRPTPYQIMAWEIKASEGYRSWWYKDGIIYQPKLKRNVQTYSIGYGYNDQGLKSRRLAIARYTADGKVTKEEAWMITEMVFNRMGTLHSDPFKNAALKLYSYNRGLITTGSKLGRCCGARKGCGHDKKSVRKSHNPRRNLEMALWTKNWPVISERTENNRQIILNRK